MPEVVALKNNHLLFPKQLVDKLFSNVSQILLAYKDKSQMLLISPAGNSWFSKLHDSHQVLLKQKNAEGDCSAAIHSILIDFDLDSSDRSIPIEINQQTGFIKLQMR